MCGPDSQRSLAWSTARGCLGGVRVAGRGPTVVVAPQQTFILPNHQAVIVAEPFPVVQRPFFIPGGVVVPVAFVPFRAFHHRLGHVIVFINPATAVVWPSAFWWRSGGAWAWVPQTIVW